LGGDLSSLKARDATRITAEEMKNMRTAGHTWTDHKTNKDIAKELNVHPVLKKRNTGLKRK
jgi:hypothetical protein